MTRTWIGPKVILVIGLLMAVVLALGLAALHQTDRINDSFQHVFRGRFPKEELAVTALRYSTENNRITMQVFLLDDPRTIQTLLAKRAQNTATITQLHDRISRLVRSGEERQLFDAVRVERGPYIKSYLKALSLLLNRKERDRARDVMVTETLPLLERYHAAMRAFVDFESEQMIQEAKRADWDSAASRTTILALLASALVTSLLIGAMMAASILKEVKKRREAEARLRASHEALETRVHERTAQLALANETLQTDVTRRLETEAALESSLARYRLLFERSLYGVARSRLDGTILSCNEAAAHLLGFSSSADLPGRSFLDFYQDPEKRREVLAGLEREGNGIWEIGFRKQDGSPVWALVNLIAVADPEAQGGRSIEGVLIDITDRKRLEEQFHQAQKMEAVGSLAGGIAHDFNNLLTAILGYTGLLLARRDLSDAVRDHLTEIHKAGERAVSLTRQLLAFSRKQVLLPEILDLNVIVRDIQKMLRRVIGEDIALVTLSEPDLQTVRADRGQIEQVLLNLAVNARDAMPGGGTLTISVGNATLDEEFVRAHTGSRAGPHVVLSVRDTGTGIDANTRKHLFEPFFTTKEKGKGTGLGLASVYGIVKQSGGYIGVESEGGRGAEFQVFLPVAEGAASAATAPNPDVLLRAMAEPLQRPAADRVN